MHTVNQDWLDQIVADILLRYPAGELLVSSGHSPSGVYHIGTMREIMTANAIAWAIKRTGRKARHLDFVDDFDALRKIPAGIPEEWKKYIGVPLRLVPDPFACHASYGEHYLSDLRDSLTAIGAQPDEQLSGYDLYQRGALAEHIASALDKFEEVKRILTEVGGRALDEHWSPVQILDDEHNLRRWKYAGWDGARKMVQWRDRDGQTGELAVGSGRVKLDWRLDWPARWRAFHIRVEPFGRDHATKGGSYDTGLALVETIFGGQAPYPVPYEFINTIGETKKMSKSAGNVLTPQQAMEVMPPEILRYFVIGSRPNRTLSFDSGLGLYRLIDEFAAARSQEPTTAIAYAGAAGGEDMISSVPFNHLVSVYQAARQDHQSVRDILERTGYAQAVADEWPIIERELVFVRNWLAKYAPDSVKFAVADALPVVELSPDQREFLGALAHTLSQETSLNGQGMHDAIYAASQLSGVKPSQAFVALYRVILGQDQGPKAGWFLASLDHKWLLQRLLKGSKAT